MLIIIGASASGKSSLASKLAGQRDIISAGGWVRAATGITGSSADDVDRMAEYAKQSLDQNPLAAAHWIGGQIDPGLDFVVEGIRNPLDLLYLAKRLDHVVDMGGSGTGDWEREGLAACRGLRDYMIQKGVTWSTPSRYFAQLLEPIRVAAEHAVLGGVEQGVLLALECYPGEAITATFLGDCGGTFHDLPLECFRARLDVGTAPLTYPEQCPGDGPPSVEPGPIAGENVTIFQDECRVGTGTALCTINWPDGNKLLHVVVAGGRIVLAPPHKMLLGNGDALPRWSKLRTVGKTVSYNNENETWEGLPPTTTVTDQFTMLVLDNGMRLLTFAGKRHKAGEDVHILDANSKELFSWSHDEWEIKGEGEAVMGAIIRIAGGAL